MSSADRKGAFGALAGWPRTWPSRYGLALITVCGAFAAQEVLERTTGFSHSFLLFYPTIFIVSLLAGFGPGAAATFLALVAAEYFYYMRPHGLALSDETEQTGLALFAVVGIALSWVADSLRRRTNRLQEFEKVVEDLEEMIVVVDQDYRYLIANRAYLKYRAITSEQVIGHNVVDLLGPAVFETQVKAKLEECFRGKVVHFEMSFWYPALGERQLVVTYLPIQGAGGINRAACVLRDITDQKRAADALQLFRALIGQSNDAVEVVDPVTLRFLDVNDKACRDLGYTREELLSMTVSDVDPVGHNPSEAEFLEKLQAEGSVIRESMHRRKDGSTFPVEVSVRYVQLEKGYLVAVARNITDRKKAEAALRESEDRYRDLIEHSEDLVCTHDLTGKFLSVNPAPARLLGYEVDELLNTRMRDLIAPEFRADFDKYLDRIGSKGADSGHLCVMAKNGRRRIWEYSNTVRTDGVPYPIVRGMAHDVTERKQAESALRRSEQRMRLFIEHAPAGAAVFDREMRYIQASRRWREDYGLGDREITGISHYDLFPEIPERWKEAHRRCLAGEVLRADHDRFERADGTLQWVRWELRPWHDKGQIGGVAIFAEDVTAQEQAAAALQSSEQRYRTLFEKTVAAVGIVSMDGQVIDCNDAWARMFGHKDAGQCRGRQMADCYRDPAQREVLLAALKKTGAFLNQEWELCRIDGSTFWVLLNSELIISENGEPVIQSTMLDITERKRAGEALRRSEESYRNFVSQSSEGIFRQDLDAPIPIDLPEEELVHRILHDSYMAECNDAIVRMYGLNSVQDVIGRRLIEFVDPSNPLNVKLTQEFIRSGFRTVNRQSYETDAQGNAKVFRNSMIGIVEEGKLVRSWGIQRDVTDHAKLESARREAVDALRQSEERFRVALQDSPITVFNQDRDLRYTWMYNPQMYWREDMLGKTDDEIIGAKRAAALNTLKQKVLSSGRGAREEVAIAQDGTSYVFDITVEPLFDSGKNVVGITAACIDIARLREIADRLQESRDRLASQKSYLESQIKTELGFEEIIGQSPALRDVLKKARVVAPTDSSVLLLGETGTGKELVARSIHSLSSRNPNTFVKLNCAAVPSGLLESELFGHEKGAFTGAVNQKIGRIELADKGTLFLDEIGEMPPELQPKLLRVLQDREFERLGGIKTLRVDVRIVSATNRDLRQDVADKKFREDLFYRLNVFPIELPPLRERRDDIPMLVQHFLKKYSTRMGRRIEIIPEDSMRILRNWNWPGNVRELENMIERMVIMSKGSELAPPPAELSEVEFTPEDNLTDMEREHILRVLRETNGVLSGNDGAASRLGLKRTTLQSMIKRLGIEPHEYRDGGATGTFAR